MELKVIKNHPLASILSLLGIATFVFRSVLARELFFDAAGTIACLLFIATGFYLAWVAKE